jgi:hypothetical protein
VKLRPAWATERDLVSKIKKAKTEVGAAVPRLLTASAVAPRWVTLGWVAST